MLSAEPMLYDFNDCKLSRSRPTPSLTPLHLGSMPDACAVFCSSDWHSICVNGETLKSSVNQHELKV